MEYGLLALIALVLGAGTAGGVLVGWSCVRRMLAIEEWLKVKDFSYEARFKELERLYIKAEKRDAAETRWTGHKKKVEADAENLLKVVGQGPGEPAGHPWDPRTWGR